MLKNHAFCIAKIAKNHRERCKIATKIHAIHENMFSVTNFRRLHGVSLQKQMFMSVMGCTIVARLKMTVFTFEGRTDFWLRRMSQYRFLETCQCRANVSATTQSVLFFVRFPALHCIPHLVNGALRQRVVGQSGTSTVCL